MSLLATDALEALLVGGGLAVPAAGDLAAYRPAQLYSLFNADVPVVDPQVRLTAVADDFRRFERQTDSPRVLGGRERALRVAFGALADNMAAFTASCQLTADLITYARPRVTVMTPIHSVYTAHVPAERHTKLSRIAHFVTADRHLNESVV